MKKITFIRRDSNRYSKIGKNRKKLQKWRRPKGRDNKMRENRFGYPKSPRVGYKTPKGQRDKADGKKLTLVHNIIELNAADKNNAVIIARVGAKKKIALLKKAAEMNIHVVNAMKEEKNATQ